jgi:hypothetical protein
MKKIALAIALASAAFVVPTAANAAQVLTISGSSGIFGDDAVNEVGAFQRTFNFLTPAGFNLASSDISSILSGTDGTTNIDFTTVTLNGVNFNTVQTGTQEFRNLLNQTIVAGANNTLFVSGTSGGAAAFSGNLTFSAVTSAVPEPGTWAMMLIGFAGIGYSMRKKPARRAHFA